MKTLDNTIWTAMRVSLWLAAKIYNMKVYGLENVKTSEGGLLAAKHSSNLDFPVGACILPGKATTLATKGVFVHPLTNYFLHVAGIVPINAPTDNKPKQPGIDAAAFKAFYRTLARKGFVMYAPEGTRVLGSVREEIYPEPIMKAAELGSNVYLIGIKYRSNYPWLSWMRLPWQAGIEVRIEQYDARNKPRDEVVEQVKDGLRRLSGLEQAVMAESAARNDR